MAALEERRIRPPGEGEVLLRVLACGLCGTDSHIVSGEFEGAVPGVVLGHEACAEVVEIGSNVKRLTPGMRVAVDPNLPCGSCTFCLNGHTHLCLDLTGLGSHVDGLLSRGATIKERLCVPLPKGLPDEVAALAEPLACVLHAIDRSGLQVGEDVAVIGAGPIGLMVAALARLRGAASVSIREANPSRVERARSLGFDADLPTQSDAGMFDVVFECAGAAPAVAHAVLAARRAGRVVWVGVAAPQAEVSIRPFDVFRRELTLIGTFTNPFTTQRAVRVLAADPARWRPLVTHVFPLSSFEEAWAIHLNGSGLKVCLRPND
jgi:threonine dehydrogenase-like Zn-dependent dehydrogenase